MTADLAAALSALSADQNARYAAHRPWVKNPGQRDQTRDRLYSTWPCGEMPRPNFAGETPRHEL